MHKLKNIRYLIVLLIVGVLCLTVLGAVVARTGSSAGERQDRADQGSGSNLEGYQKASTGPLFDLRGRRRDT